MKLSCLQSKLLLKPGSPMENNNYHLSEMRSSIVSLEKQVAESITKLAASIESLADKIETLSSMHLKIIYWLLIVVTLTLVGVKGAETFGSLNTTLPGVTK